MNFKRIRTGEAKALLDQGNLNIADIRDELSYEAGHIRSAVRVDNSNLQQFMQGCDKDAPLVVCCYHGNSSQGAAQFFASQGFSQVYSVDGGYEMWKLGFPELCERS